MIEMYELNSRKHWRITCSSCKQFLYDTAPLSQNIAEIEDINKNICPICKKPIHLNTPKVGEPKA